MQKSDACTFATKFNLFIFVVICMESTTCSEIPWQCLSKSSNITHLGDIIINYFRRKNRKTKIQTWAHSETMRVESCVSVVAVSIASSVICRSFRNDNQLTFLCFQCVSLCNKKFRNSFLLPKSTEIGQNSNRMDRFNSACQTISIYTVSY